jgi:lipoyl(octanoyl) transferase
MTNRFDILDLGRRAYRPVLELQERLVEDRRAGRIPDTLILVEHEPVYTLGRNADERHIVAPAEELQRLGIDVVKTGRGGDVTYHGPGQLVGYPILDLGARGEGAVWYVGALEELLICVLADFGVRAGRDPINRGVWVGAQKIAAIGVRISRRITMHGFALNVCTDLTHYRGIIPCGLADRGVTSLNLFVKGVSIPDVKRSVVEHFRKMFGEDTPS